MTREIRGDDASTAERHIELAVDVVTDQPESCAGNCASVIRKSTRYNNPSIGLNCQTSISNWRRVETCYDLTSCAKSRVQHSISVVAGEHKTNVCKRF